MMADEATRDLPIAVFCSIDEKRLLSSTVGTPDRRASVPELVEYGLRARLATESMVTGILYISLTFTPEEVGTRNGDVDGLPEVPALQSSSERMESGVEIVLDKLSGLDLGGLVEELKRAVKSIGDLAEKTDSLAVELAGGVADTRAALASAQQLIEHADRAIDPFSTSLTAAAGDVGSAARRLTGTLEGFDETTNPDAPLIVELRASLAELASAARAARSLLEQIDRDPSQLLRGRSVGSGDSH
jgi:paraquat-inducible protein B